MKKAKGIHEVILSIVAVFVLLSCAGQSTQHNEQLAEANREIGEAYIRQGDYTSALRELLKAEKLNPEDSFVHNDLGICYMAKKLLPDAIVHFKKAIALKPTYTPARNNLGTAYLAAKQWDAAIAVFEEITKDVLYATPQFPLSNLGLAYYNKGDYKNAIHYYKEALQLQPKLVFALFGLGRAYLDQNEGQLALRYLEQAAQLAPKVGEYQYYLAEAYLLTGQTAKARNSYMNVIELTSQESDLAIMAKRRLGMLR